MRPGSGQTSPPAPASRLQRHAQHHLHHLQQELPIKVFAEFEFCRSDCGGSEAHLIRCWPRFGHSRSISDISKISSQSEGMAVPEVDQEMLRELESMGFPTARATRALHYSGNCSLDAAIDWVVEHEDDTDIDQMPLVHLNITIESGKPSLTPEAVKIKAQELREYVSRKKGEEQKIERESEKERIRVGKELLEAKRILEENERRRMLALRQAEKEEEQKAREKILQRLEEDKAERRRMLGLSPADPKPVKVTKPPPQEKNMSLPVKPARKAAHMRDCLRSLKKNHKDEDVRVKRAFQTLLIYVGNVAKNPDEEKFRKIRLSNPTFQDRVGSLKGGIQFLELCGFEKIEGDQYLYLPRDKMDMIILKTAGLELNSAKTNPFFGVL